jgi:hypothetical protein
MTNPKATAFDTDYGIIGLSVCPQVSEADFNFDDSILCNDNECGATSNLATRSFVIAAISSKIKKLEEKISILEDRLSKLENTK